MSLSYFVKGLLIGFAIAAPVGPIGVLCIRRSLIQGRLYGWLSGLGAATADALYGSVAGFGLTVITGFLMGGKIWLQVIGVFFCAIWAFRRCAPNRQTMRRTSAKGTC